VREAKKHEFEKKEGNDENCHMFKCKDCSFVKDKKHKFKGEKIDENSCHDKCEDCSHELKAKDH